MFTARPQTNSIALASLLIANCIPLAGVMFFGWKVFDVMVLFWLENVVVGVINIFRMVSVLVLRRAYEAAIMIPFFCFHYGMFTMIHGVFVFTLFGGLDQAVDGNGELFDVLKPGWITPPLIVAAAGLFVSHLISFVFNFIGGGEYRKLTSVQLMAAPYKRVVVLHLTIIFGGMLAMATRQATWALILLLALKTAIDLKAHIFEHEKLGKKGETDQKDLSRLEEDGI